MNTPFIVQEFLSGASINGPLWGTPRDSVTWTVKLQWLLDMANGMAYIHQRGYTHRDLKSANVLYDLSSMRAKVADFGMARSMEDDKKASSSSLRSSLVVPLLASPEPTSPEHRDHLMTAQCGTPGWMAPELCRYLISHKSLPSH